MDAKRQLQTIRDSGADPEAAMLPLNVGALAAVDMTPTPIGRVMHATPCVLRVDAIRNRHHRPARSIPSDWKPSRPATSTGRCCGWTLDP